MTPKELYDAAAQRHHDALQKLVDQHASAIPDLSAQLAQSRADYDALLTNMATYLNAASDQIEAAEGVAAATETAPAVASAAQPIPATN